MKPSMLSSYFDVEGSELLSRAVSDPMESVAVDVAELQTDSRIPEVRVSGTAYDASTGLVETVVSP
ncbi:hypothetical protein ACNHUS_23385 [Actinomycetes bacterium M1A6_2h]